MCVFWYISLWVCIKWSIYELSDRRMCLCVTCVNNVCLTRVHNWYKFRPVIGTKRIRTVK